MALTRVVGKPADDGHDTPHVRRVISNCRQRFQHQAADHLPAAKKQSLRSPHVCRRYPTGPTSAVTDHAPGATHPRHPKRYDLTILLTDQQACPYCRRQNYVRWLAPDICGCSDMKLASCLLALFGKLVNPCLSVIKPSLDVYTSWQANRSRISVCVADN